MNEIESKTFLTHRNQLAKVSEQIEELENETADVKKQCMRSVFDHLVSFLKALRLENDLQQDLSRSELIPYYQQVETLQAKLTNLSKYKELNLLYC